MQTEKHIIDALKKAYQGAIQAKLEAWENENPGKGTLIKETLQLKIKEEDDKLFILGRCTLYKGPDTAPGTVTAQAEIIFKKDQNSS